MIGQLLFIQNLSQLVKLLNELTKRCELEMECTVPRSFSLCSESRYALGVCVTHHDHIRTELLTVGVNSVELDLWSQQVSSISLLITDDNSAHDEVNSNYGCSRTTKMGDNQGSHRVSKHKRTCKCKWPLSCSTARGAGRM